MERDELHPNLKRAYKDSLQSGVEKVDHPKCKGLWFVVPPAPPRITPDKLPPKKIAEAAEVIARQPNIEEATDLDRLVSYLFLRKEAVESSRMEGTMSTIDHVLTPGDMFDEWKTKSEGASVRGYAVALEEELKRVKTDGLSIFTIDLVSRLHKETMGLDPRFKGVPGKIREDTLEAVSIGGQRNKPETSLYNPAPPRHVRRCLKELMNWLGDAQFVEAGDAGIGSPLIVRMAIGHSHFEAIHPFTDGNGRVGRMLLTLQMACYGKVPIYLSGYIEEEKHEYIRVLQEAQKKLNYGPIVDFFASALIESSREARHTREHIESLPSIWLKRGSFRANSTAQRALSWLISHPIFSVRQLEEALSVSTPAANAAVQQLQKYKVVRERTGFERKRVFSAEEVISLLSRRFGSSPEEALSGARHRIENSTSQA